MEIERTVEDMDSARCMSCRAFSGTANCYECICDLSEIMQLVGIQVRSESFYTRFWRSHERDWSVPQ